MATNSFLGIKTSVVIDSVFGVWYNGPMKPNDRFRSLPASFWANVKLVSEQAGYSIRARNGESKQLRSYTLDDVRAVYSQEGLDPTRIDQDDRLFKMVVEYLNYRAETINRQIQPLFMNRDEAAEAYHRLVRVTGSNRSPSMNKQKGEKRHPAYLASMVSLIAEKVLGADGFVDDARRLAVLISGGVAQYTFSRRYDGAFPDVVNPVAVWEIKEYYGTTTFGSRVADGVYETLLDGFEISESELLSSRRVKHFLFVDDRFTWWECGRSYLCRMVDMLHTGHVDQIFFGKEVLTEWETALAELVNPSTESN